MTEGRRRIVVFHTWYGCETGCCGHAVGIVPADAGDDFHATSLDESEFYWEHPNGDSHIEFAKQMVAEKFGDEHVQDLDWDNCIIVDSC